MNEFLIYLQLGYQHITDINGYDHILFVIALCAIYRMSDWQKILYLVTAFTIGHSITLALAALELIEYSTDLIEFLIPVTIIVTCFANFFHRSTESVLNPEKFSRIRYLFAMMFGLIHGMGFANSIRWMMASSQHLLIPLASFNIGIEVAQAIVVLFVLLIGTLLIEKMGIKKKWWIAIISGTTGIIALMMCLQRLPL